MLDLDRSSLYYGLANGTLVQESDGKIDLDHPVNEAFLRARMDTAGASTRVAHDPRGQIDTPPTETEQEWAEGVDCLDLVSLINLPRHQIAGLKDVQAIREREQKLRQRNGELIERDLVRKVFGRLYTVLREEFLTAGMALSADVAAALGVNDDEKILEAEKIIETGMFRRMGSVKKVLQEYLDDQQS